MENYYSQRYLLHTKNVKIILDLSHPKIFHIPSKKYRTHENKTILHKWSSNQHL